MQKFFLLVFFMFNFTILFAKENDYDYIMRFKYGRGEYKEYVKCDAKPDYRKNITNVNWLYDNKVENSKYCRNYQVFLCNQMTICKNDSQCQYEAARYYLSYRTKEELIESKKHLFKKDYLDIIDENIKNWKPYNEFIIEELNKRKEYCDLEREICNNSNKKDKKCLKKAMETFNK